MTELLGIIAMFALTCSGVPSPCSLPQLEIRTAEVVHMPLPPPKPVSKPVRKSIAAKPNVAPRRVVAEADDVLLTRTFKRRPIPIFIGAFN